MATRAILSAISESKLHGPVILGNPNQWFNRLPFLAPPVTAGFTAMWAGHIYRAGACDVDFLVLKNTRIRESLNLQFRRRFSIC